MSVLLWRYSSIAAVVLPMSLASAALAQDSEELDRLGQSTAALTQAGRHREAVAEATRVLAVQERTKGAGHIRVGQALLLLATAQLEAGDANSAERSAVRAQSILASEASPAATDRHKVLLLRMRVANARVQQAQATAFMAQATALTEFGNLAGRTYDAWKVGRHQEALPIAEAALAAALKVGPQDPTVGLAHLNIAAQLNPLGRLSEAAEHYEKSRAVHRAVSGLGRVKVESQFWVLGQIQLRLGRLAQAEETLRAVVDAFEREGKATDAQLAPVFLMLGQTLDAGGRLPEATPHYERSIAIFAASAGPDDPQLPYVLWPFANNLARQGRHAEAERALLRLLPIVERQTGPDHAALPQFLEALGMARWHQSKFAEAEPAFQRSLDMRKKLGQGEDVTIASVLAALAVQQNNTGKPQLAEANMVRAAGIMAQLNGDGLEHYQALLMLGSAQLGRARFAEAEATLRRIIAIVDRLPEAQQGLASDPLRLLVSMLNDQGRYAEAEPLARRSVPVTERAAGASSPMLAEALNQLGLLLSQTKRSAEAEPLLTRAVAIWEKQGAEHPSLAMGLNNLGTALGNLRRWEEAERTHARALGMREKLLGPDHPDVANSLNNLGVLHSERGRYAEAEPLLRRSAAILEKTLGPEREHMARALHGLAMLHVAWKKPEEAEALLLRSVAVWERNNRIEHPQALDTLTALSNAYRQQDKYTEADQALARVSELRERTVGPDHPDTAETLVMRGRLLNAQGRPGEAEPILRRALAIRERHFGPRSYAAGSSLNDLAIALLALGRTAEAEPMLRSYLSIAEETLGAESVELGTALNNLGMVYSSQERWQEAETINTRVRDIWLKAVGPDHPDYGIALSNLGEAQRLLGKYKEAEENLRRSIAIREKAFGPLHRDVGLAIDNLGSLLADMGRIDEAVEAVTRALEIRTKTLGPDHPDLATTLISLGVLRDKQFEAHGKSGDDEARPLQERALAIRQASLPPGHPLIGKARSALGYNALLHERWLEARLHFDYATSILNARSQRDLADSGRAGARSEIALGADLGLVRATHRLMIEKRIDMALDGYALQPAFEAVQRGRGSQAAASLALMAARQAAGDGPLARVLRERQDLEGEEQALDREFMALKTRAPDPANAARAGELAARQAAARTRMAQIDGRLATEFPDYERQVSTAPLALDETIKLLAPDEALVVFLDAPANGSLPEMTFIFIVTHDGFHFGATRFGTRVLNDYVLAMRCGLDGQGMWANANLARTCTRLLSRERPLEPGEPLPFDAGLAHELYNGLFEGVEPVIRGKKLLIVPSGALTALPFQVLVTERPTMRNLIDDDFSRFAWLARTSPVTVLPSVASLKSLRRQAAPSKAAGPYIGVGNPLLAGPEGKDRRAWERQGCGRSGLRTQVASRAGSRSTTIGRFFRGGGLADVDEVRRMDPLPETVDELCAVADLAGAGAESVLLGERASEREIKALSRSGALANARVLHFATHGLLAGETEALTTRGGEPALLLTPPAQASEEDDGLLTASEVSQLRLDADWVVLSACNTASGGALEAESLSGLARAFFYAGARSLLVSHWYVDSDATVALITRTFAVMKSEPELGRAGALRRAMLSLVDAGGASSHPAFWAPFVVVGESGR